MKRRLFPVFAVVFLALFFVAGCAFKQSAESSNGVQTSAWSGRLQLRTLADPANPQIVAQTFNAGFELHGNARAGLLRLSTPLGTTAALIEWTSQGAKLNVPGETQSFANLDVLSQQLLGTVVPVASFFDWLQGVDRAVDGWSVNFSEFEQGKISAHRQYPAPTAELKLLLEN